MIIMSQLRKLNSAARNEVAVCYDDRKKLTWDVLDDLPILDGRRHLEIDYATLRRVCESLLPMLQWLESVVCLEDVLSSNISHLR